MEIKQQEDDSQIRCLVNWKQDNLLKRICCFQKKENLHYVKV